jgi:hypothetical protein
VYVDPDLLQYDKVGAAPADIVRVASGVVTDLKRN